MRYVYGLKVLYLLVLREIYECIKSDLLCYNPYVKVIKLMGLNVNTYDICMANKTINVKQCIILSYIYDKEISHVDESITKQFLSEVKKHFEDLVISRGKKNIILWMSINIREDSKIDM